MHFAILAHYSRMRHCTPSRAEVYLFSLSPLSLFKRGGVSELNYAQSEDRPPSQATVTVFKKHLVSKVPHLEQDREGSTVSQV